MWLGALIFFCLSSTLKKHGCPMLVYQHFISRVYWSIKWQESSLYRSQKLWDIILCCYNFMRGSWSFILHWTNYSIDPKAMRTDFIYAGFPITLRVTLPSLVADKVYFCSNSGSHPSALSVSFQLAPLLTFLPQNRHFVCIYPNLTPRKGTFHTHLDSKSGHFCTYPKP